MRTVLIVFYIFVVVFFCCITLKDFNDYSVTPRDVYDVTKLNWIGTMLLYALYLFFNPIYFLLHFLRWLVTFGRRD